MNKWDETINLTITESKVHGRKMIITIDNSRNEKTMDDSASTMISYDEVEKLAKTMLNLVCYMKYQTEPIIGYMFD